MAEVIHRWAGVLAGACSLVRECGRIHGYLETIVGVLKHHLDGRKLAGVKRAARTAWPSPVPKWVAGEGSQVCVDRLVAAEGYFRALADSLRV